MQIHDIEKPEIFVIIDIWQNLKRQITILVQCNWNIYLANLSGLLSIALTLYLENLFLFLYAELFANTHI